ncbi:MAG: aminotransferase class V-fold PLP-dependent enzyme [Nakamurella sp.]
MTIFAADDGRSGTLKSRLQWSLDPCVTHINHGSFGAVPVAVQQEQTRLRQLMDANPVRWFASLSDRIGEARVDMAGLLGVDPAHFAFVLNASAGAATVFNSLMGTKPIDVMTTNHGYGAVSMGAERLARRSGGNSVILDIPLDATEVDTLTLVEDAMDAHRPTLLVIDQISSATARAFPVDDICRTARERGVTTLIDGAHAPGMLADPLCREADYWFGNLHKFACAPRGTAVLVARGDGQDLDPVIDSWGAHLPFPQRFDHTGTLDTTSWLTAPFAWRHIQETVGWDAARKLISDLLDEGTAVVAEALAHVMDDPIPEVGQPVGGMRLLRLPGTLGSDHDEADGLRIPFSDQVQIACAFANFEGRGYLRLSAHLYNSIRDYQHLAAVGVPLLNHWATVGRTAAAS